MSKRLTDEARHADTERNRILNMTLIDLDRTINGHDPEVDTSINNMVWDRLDKMAVEIEALAHRRATPTDDLRAENERLRGALRVADEYLTILQRPGAEPLNSLNHGKNAGPIVAHIRNEAREVWAIIGNVMDHGMTVDQARAALSQNGGAA